MKINIKATNLELTPAIRQYIEIKIGSLDHFLRHFVGVRPCVGLKRFESKPPHQTRIGAKSAKNNNKSSLWCGGKSEIEVFVEIVRTTRHHHKGNIFYAEAIFSLCKKILRAEHSDWDIRVAIDKVKDKLQQEIKKYKEIKIEKCRET